MARRQVVAIVRIQIPAGQATPAPPVGTALGPHGVAIMEFCKQYNAATQQHAGLIIPVIITVYQDRSFTFILKSPPASVLLKKAAGIASGSATPNKVKVAKVTRQQVEDIAKQKASDLNSHSMEMAMRMVEGTARSMGIEVQ